jgi:hypothetical protein
MAQKKTFLGVADVDNFFMVFYKFEIRMGDPTMLIAFVKPFKGKF